MESFCWSSGLYGSDFQRTHDGVWVNSGMGHGSVSASASASSLVLDSVRGELVEAPAKLERKMVSVERSVEALKNHSEAEKRRRARINAHLDTLRSLIPGAKTMDKASLLAEVISHLKDLKRKTAEATDDSESVIPKDIDELKVEPYDELVEGRPYSIRVSLSCDYKPGLLSDLRRTLDALHLMIMRAEVATLGCRMKNVFVMTTACKEEKAEVDEVPHFHAKSVCQALRSVLDKFSTSQELVKTTLPNKRRRVSMFNP